MSQFREWLHNRAVYPALLSVQSLLRGAGWRPMRQLRLFRKLARSEPAVWQAYRDRLLAGTLMHALRESPFYQPLAPRLAPLAANQPMEALREFPVLTKADLQAHKREILARNYPERRLVVDYTGGSTGTPTRCWFDRRHQSIRLLGSHRNLDYIGWRPSDRMAYIDSPRGMFWTHSRLKRAVNRVSGMYIGLNILDGTNPEAKRAFLKEMEAARPRFLWAISSGVHEYAAFIESEGLTARAQALGLRGIVHTCDRLLPEQRERVERAFGARTFSVYGSHGTGLIATECSAHNGMHVGADNVLVEVLDERGQPAPAGASGRIVVTDLWNRGWPVIRHDLSDIGRFLADEPPCPCGVTFPRLASIEGRVSDFLTLSDGRRVHGECITVALYALPGVSQFQVVQDSPGEAVLSISGDPAVCAPGVREAIKGLPAGLNVRVNFCKDIPLSATGKRHYIISRLPAPRLSSESPAR